MGTGTLENVMSVRRTQDPIGGVGTDKTYWVCAHCTRKFLLWEKDERDKATQAARALLELATRK